MLRLYFHCARLSSTIRSQSNSQPIPPWYAVRSKQAVILLLTGMTLAATAAWPQVLQSSGGNGRLWLTTDSRGTRVGEVNGAAVQLDLPPGAVLHDLEPTASGWLAAGRIPSSRGTELLLIESRDGVTDLIEGPGRGPGRLRGQPILMLEKERLVGLVWAEGDGHRELEIWAAPREEEAWGTSERIAAKGPGSQVTPAALVLDDGSWLVVWSAFDGMDTEILWSRRVTGTWTSPDRVHADNEVPDLTPDLAVVDGGALLAWSWFDGNDNRLRTARLANGRWTLPKTFGEKGSVDPSFIESQDGLRLVYQTVSPPTWTVLDLDRSGTSRRQAMVPVDTNERPLLLIEEDGSEELHWPELHRQSPVARVYPLQWQELP
jgi:hypothetical protein